MAEINTDQSNRRLLAMDLEPEIFPLSSGHRSDSSSFSHVASGHRSDSFASSYIRISLLNRTIHHLSTRPSNFRRFSPEETKKIYSGFLGSEITIDKAVKLCGLSGTKLIPIQICGISRRNRLHGSAERVLKRCDILDWEQI